MCLLFTYKHLLLTGKKMRRQISPVSMIDQQPGKRWTALVHVLECHHMQHPQDQSEFKRIIRTDPQGMKLTALIFGNHQKYYANTFRQYRRYYISNAVVKKPTEICIRTLCVFMDLK